MRILTLNAGLLGVLGGRIEFAPFVEERLKELPAQLRNLDADLVALQEVYRQRHRNWIISELADVYPHSVYFPRRRNWGLENSLMVFSKTPASGRLELFRDMPLDERLLDSKGVLICRIETAKCLLSFLNMHTTAGGSWWHPESPSANLVRAKQVNQLISLADAEPGITLIAGDLNAGPGVSEENFQQLLSAGYVSTYDRLHGNNGECTWDPENRLNRKGPHKACPPQRIDHILIRSADVQSGKLKLLSATICCREEIVAVGKQESVTIADHFGLQVEIDFGE